MSSWVERMLNAARLLTALSVSLCALLMAVPAQAFEGIGRAATPKEVAAWDIDVRPDFKGLPKGSGTVRRGQEVWDGKCASCHGTFGESNEVFTPIVGGTTAEDIKSGRVAALSNGRQPQRTSMMKLATVSTLWDYINRAMPWNEPKSLSVTDVYAVTAYILNMAEVLPDDFELSDANIASVQARLPNRNGMSNAHGLWDVKGKPDVKNTACMKNCETPVTVKSQLPASSRAAHGNLAEQQRLIGPVRGVALSGAAVSMARPKAVSAAAPNAAPGAAPAAADAARLAQDKSCMACHGIKQKIVGPSFAEVASRYKADAQARTKLVAKLKSGGAGNWGQTPMPPQDLPEAELKSLVDWILATPQ
jgi:cytochrome c551/c552